MQRQQARQQEGSPRARGQGFQALSRAWQKCSTLVRRVPCQPAQPENILQGTHKQKQQA
jgi:hypothetical protein